VGVPLSDASFSSSPLAQRHEICSQETRDSSLSYGVNAESISPGLESVRVVPDRQTDGQTDLLTEWTSLNTWFINVIFRFPVS